MHLKTSQNNCRFVTALLLLLVMQAVEAHTLYDVYIHVFLNDLGHARVIETMLYDITDSGSEIYIKQYNLGVMKVGELAVADETGVDYKVYTPWIEDAGRETKKEKCGIYKGDSGPELCWGIGDMGRRLYVARYTLTRMVKAFDDYDGFNFNFYDAASPHPRHVKVAIEKYNGAFTSNDTRIWAFGFHGQVNLVDGRIVAESEVDDINNITVMARFNKNLFHPVTFMKGTFRDRLQKKAFEGSSYSLEMADEHEAHVKASKNGNGQTSDEDEGGLMGFLKPLWEMVEGIVSILAWIAVFFYPIVGFFNLKSEISRNNNLKRLFGVPKPEAQQWRRDIPLNGDLNYANAVVNAVNDGTNTNLMAAHILRMAYQGRISLVPQVNGKGGKNRAFLINHPGPPPLNNHKHNEADIIYLLHTFMWNAAGSDHVLEPKEVVNYVKKYPVEHRDFVKRLNRYLSKPELSLGKVKQEAAQEVFGLKKFLQEFTLIEERHLEEVALWREYMVYATLFGIADQVKQDLKTIWPITMPKSVEEFVMGDTVVMTTVLCDNTRRAISYVESYETPEEYRARLAREAEESRSSGGGGSSSYGGGGGSSGGGGSGIR